VTEPALVIDCRGKRCPLPILALARRIREIEIGSLIAVDADDPAAAGDVKAWCSMRWQEYVTAGTAPDGVPRFTVRRLR
jgi:tRNA 2-thiouridine synthesizing protein A